VLLVSQFTLLAQIKKGKPDFRGAADANKARQLYDYFYSKVRDLYTPDRVKNGVFQAMMEVGLVNDGPVTLEIDTNPPKKQGEDTGSEPNSELSKDPKDLNQEEPLNSRDQVQQIEFQLPTSLLE